MNRRALACALALAGLAAGGCGGGSAAGGTSGAGSFRHAFAAAQPQLHSIVTGLDAAAATVAARSTAGLADRLNALAGRAQQEASTLEQLGPPPRYNTRLRDVGAALNAAAAELDSAYGAATGHSAAAARAAAAAVRADAAAVGSTATAVATVLSLPTG